MNYERLWRKLGGNLLSVSWYNNIKRTTKLSQSFITSFCRCFFKVKKNVFRHFCHFTFFFYKENILFQEILKWGHDDALFPSKSFSFSTYEKDNSVWKSGIMFAGVYMDQLYFKLFWLPKSWINLKNLEALKKEDKKL